MKNKYKLPEYLENSLCGAWQPNLQRFGATTLVEPPLIRTLKAKYWDKLEEEISEKLWMIHGNAIDALVKRHSRFGLTNLKFEHVWCQDKEGRDIIVVIKPDYYNVLTKILADVKDTSVWTIINGKEEYEQQVNIYDFIMFKECPQLVIHDLELHLFAKDWKKNEKLRNGGADYPEIPFKVVPQRRWSREEQFNFIDARIRDHLDNPMRECTPKEKWQAPDIYAVHVKGNKTARGGTAQPKTREEAQAWIDSKSVKTGKQYEIKFRPGGCKRCEEYCPVSKYCPFFNKGK
jgi:hypothetical protein